jgi:carbamoyltransferase
MKQCILGISSFGHDTSACLVDVSNTKIIFASAQERYSNIKYDDTVPFFTINECIRIANDFNYKIIKATISCDYQLFLGDYLYKRILRITENKDITDKYLLLLKKNLNNSDYYSKFSIKKNFINKFLDGQKTSINDEAIKNIKDVTSWYFNWSIKHRQIHRVIQKFIGNIELVPIKHHLSHAASTYFNSGFDNSGIIVIDGQGEEDTITIYDASDRDIKLISRTSWPNSLGMFYLAGTKYLGYKLGDEYKVMGMSAYGTNKFTNHLEKAFNIDNDGILSINETDAIGFKNIKHTSHENIYFKQEFENTLAPNTSMDFQQEHFDFAKSMQTTIEDIGIKLAEWTYEKTNKSRICLSGGVALNGLMNNKILNLDCFNDAFAYPASGDDGTSVGSALYYLSQNKQYEMNNKKLSICFHGYEEKFIIEDHKDNLKNLIVEKNKNPEKFIAEKINNQKVVAIYNSGSEFGPRALGARSILANPTNHKIKEILNKKIKLREPFRPFAPICLKEKVHDYFNIKNDSNFMLFICEALEKNKHLIPGVVHEDNTARVQSVSKDNVYLYNILNEFYKLSNVPVLINTSFNIGGESIVNTINDAINSFKKMDIDFLIIDNYVISKSKEFSKEKISTNEFILRRRKHFLDINNHPIISITKYNCNFYSNIFVYLKKKIFEKLFNQKCI